MVMEDFLDRLSSADPVPGGGGVAALCGALSASLASMVANLTTGKKKYAEYQQDIERIIEDSAAIRDELYSFIAKDAEAFEPLSKAYGIPKDEPGRDERLEEALMVAARTPLELVICLEKLVGILLELSTKGSRLAVSDVGVAATLLEAGAKSAVLNVYINTKLMKNEDVAKSFNMKAERLVSSISDSCSNIYANVESELKKF